MYEGFLLNKEFFSINEKIRGVEIEEMMTKFLGYSLDIQMLIDLENIKTRIDLNSSQSFYWLVNLESVSGCLGLVWPGFDQTYLL